MNEFIIGREYEVKENFRHNGFDFYKGVTYLATSERSIRLKGDKSFTKGGSGFPVDKFKLVEQKEVISNLKDTTASYANELTDLYVFKRDENKKDMTWSEILQQAPQYERINMQGEIAALKIKNELAENKYNQLCKENIKLSLDYESDKLGFSFSITELENTIKDLRSEIEDYKKTIKSFESDRNEVKKDPMVYGFIFIAIVFMIAAYIVTNN